MDPISTKIALGAAGAGGGSEYWIATLSGIDSDYAYGVTTDSSGNVIIAGHTRSSGAGYSDFLIAKYDATGNIQWQKTIGSTSYDNGYGVVVDSSDDIYIVGNTILGTVYNGSLIKLDSSGVIQWQRTLGGTGSDQWESVAIDSSNNLYVGGYAYSSTQGLSDFFLAKYNSSGTLQWQRTFGGTGYDFGFTVALDSSSNVYIVGNTASAGQGGRDFLIAKYNSSGTLLQQRILGGTLNDIARGVTTDSVGNMIVTGDTYNAGPGGRSLVTAKYNTSMGLLWQRSIGSTLNETARHCTTDSSDNIYICGDTDDGAGGSTDAFIAKYSSSGTLQWQRTFGTSTGGDIFYDVYHDSGYLYLSGMTRDPSTNIQNALIVKLPDDGSLTGTYGNFTYAASSLTDSASFLTSASSGLSSSTSSFTDSTTSYTAVTSSLTSSTTPM